MAAQSFHFVDPLIGLPKAAALLRPGGALALFGTRPQRGESEMEHRIQEAYARHASALEDGLSDTPWEDQIDATELFGTVIMTRYRWQATYATDEYVGLTETQSPQRLLAPDALAGLLQEIRDAIDAFGGTIQVDYVTRLYVAGTGGPYQPSRELNAGS
jgi:hypothetical protein